MSTRLPKPGPGDTVGVFALLLFTSGRGTIRLGEYLGEGTVLAEEGAVKPLHAPIPSCCTVPVRMKATGRVGWCHPKQIRKVAGS